jgi:hypothetical protein
MKKDKIIIVLLCLIANFAIAQSKIVKKINLETIEKKRFDYMVKGDIKKLSIFLDSSLFYIHSNGEVHNYSTFLQSIESKNIEYTYYEFKNSSYKLFGKIAVGTGDLLVKGMYKGTPFEVEIRFTSINKKKKHSWKLIHWQSTKINP